MKNHKARPFGFIFLFVLLFSSVLSEEARSPRLYIVGGERHGVSFFPYVDYPETRPKVEGEMDFSHYHKYAEVLYFLKKWEKEYPDLVELYSVGKSFEGRDIWQITITNKATGKDTDKPAMFLEGNRHSGEVTAAESALYFAWYVLSNCGQDPKITHLVDTKALYVRVKNNPDGSELYLNTAQSNRSTVRPHDSDGDGLLDEDPPKDLDGDGFISQMRQKVEEGKGEYIIDPEDKSGRLMKRVGKGKGNYLIYSEGLDNDGDGKYNEDGIGGLDLHRNYPENWRPEPGLDNTGRGLTQRGAGAYPLSEPETRAVVLFLLQHPNVSVGQTMDTIGPMHLRGPSTSRSEESMFPEDLKLFRYFDEQGKRITGYKVAGDIYWEIPNLEKKIREPDPLEHEKPEPTFGHSPDFGYFYFGSIWYGDELWCGGKVKDYDKDGIITTLESLRWNDEALGGKGFINWRRYIHPQLGEVETGGFNMKFFFDNPPPEYLEEWAKKEAMFNLFLAESLPQVKIISVEVKPLRKKADTYEVVCVFCNEGFLPTALEMAKRIKIIRPDWAEIKFSGAGAELLGSNEKVELGTIRSKEMREVRWKIKLTGNSPIEAEISISSTRGGVEKKTIKIEKTKP
jgi:hypothetical protein